MSEGIKVAQRGVDIGGAADFQLVLNTERPMLKIYKQGSINLTSDGVSDVVVATHDLQYPVPFMIWDDGSTLTELNGAREYTAQAGFRIDSSKNLIYNSFSVPNFTGAYIIFDYDMSKTFQATAEHATPISQAAAGEGVLVTQPNKNIDSTDGRDFSINTSFRPFSVHMSGKVTVDAAVGQFTITHNLGYIPATLLFHYDDFNGYTIFIAKTQATSVDTTFQGVQSVMSGDMYYIILKDPIFIGA